MDQIFGIILLFLALISGVLSLVKKFKKEKTGSSSTDKSKESSTPLGNIIDYDVENSREDDPYDFSGESNSREGIQNITLLEEFSQTHDISSKNRQHTKKYSPNKLRELSSCNTTDGLTNDNYFDYMPSSENSVNDNDLKNKENNFTDDFDWKKAVIYYEILKPKF